MSMMPTSRLPIEQDAIRVQVIEDSITVPPYGSDQEPIRLTTVQLRYPRFIHAELMTHRVFSRNARSSRAVPTPRLVNEPIFMPHFASNMPGMQAGEEASDELQAEWEKDWDELAQHCCQKAMKWHNQMMHKQWANRCLEWFGFIDVLVTSTDWHNFFNLRDHKDAMPEIQQLARMIRDALEVTSIHTVPRHPWDETNIANWHLPFIPLEDRVSGEYSISDLCKISAARCARISYTPFDSDKVDVQADFRLFHQLLESQPLHASPGEHIAVPDTMISDYPHGVRIEYWANKHEHGNFYGWRQFRKMLPNEAAFDTHYGYRYNHV